MTGIQADFEPEDLLAGIQLDKLDEAHRNELQSLVDQMKKQEEGDTVGALIMYEITGYQGSAIQNWSDYHDDFPDDDVGEGEGGGQLDLLDIQLAAAAQNNGGLSSAHL